MASAHARKRTGRTYDSKAHPGQLQGSARKRKHKQQRLAEARLARMHRKLAETNKAQQRQNQVGTCQIVINGMPRWQDVYKDVIFDIRPGFVKYFGASRVPALEFFAIDSGLGHVSFEREVLGDLLSRGYELEELEVEFDSEEGGRWGICSWYKDHPSYHAPDKELRKLFPKATAKGFSFLSAMFKTEHAGDQKRSVLSSQMLGQELFGLGAQILLHKTLIFRRVVLAQPSLQGLAKAA